MQNLILILSCCFVSTLLHAQEDKPVFSTCSGQLTYPYYYPALKNKSNFFELKQHFSKGYPIKQFQKMELNTGIITVQFKINCEGESGDFTIQQCDLNYQPIVLNEAIGNYFLDKCRSIQGWIPVQDENGNSINSHKFFSFRIKNGELIEILPK